MEILFLVHKVIIINKASLVKSEYYNQTDVTDRLTNIIYLVF